MERHFTQKTAFASGKTVISQHYYIRYSMGAFFRILLVAILIFYAFNIIVKLIFRHKMKKLQKQMEQFQQGGAEAPSDEAKTPHVDPNIGEYTDFEEVE